MPALNLDRIDRRILAELQQDGGLTNQALAERVGLSPSPCLRRVKALEEAGVIGRRVTCAFSGSVSAAANASETA